MIGFHFLITPVSHWSTNFRQYPSFVTIIYFYYIIIFFLFITIHILAKSGKKNYFILVLKI